jgi:SOS-response transcriptional repressors
MSLLDRIKIKAKEQGLTIPGIEEKLSFGKHSMYRWDTNSPSVDKVVSVANLLNVSVDYLITGNDLITTTTELQSLIQRYNNLSESDKNKVNIFIEIASLKSKEDFYSNENIKNKDILMESTVNYHVQKKSVPLLGKVAAGIPISLVESYLDKVAAPSDKVDFATIANGHSMEPVIYDGENIFIKSMQSLDNGDIGVFDINGETTCKRFKYDLNTKTVILTSFNSDFKPLTYPLKNYQDTFRIIGKVILTEDQENRYHNFIQK